MSKSRKANRRRVRKPVSPRVVAGIRKQLAMEMQANGRSESVTPAPRVGQVIAPPLVTLHNYNNGSRLFVNGTQRMKLWPDGANHTTINTVAALLTELQAEGAVRVEAADFRELSTEL